MTRARQKPESFAGLCEPTWMRVAIAAVRWALLTPPVCGLVGCGDGPPAPTVAKTVTGHVRGPVPAASGTQKSTAANPDRQTPTASAGTEKSTTAPPDRRKYVALIETSGGPVSVAFAPDGSAVAEGNDTYPARVWDPVSGQEARVLAPPAKPPSRCVAFSADGKRLASAANGIGGYKVNLWDAATGNLLQSFVGHKDTVNSVAVSPDGLTVASGGDDGLLAFWDAATGAERRSLRQPNHSVTAVAFVADGRTLAAGYSDGTVRVWDVATGTEAWKRHVDLPGETLPEVRAVALAPGGTLAVAGRFNAVLVWNVKSGAAVRVLEGHTDWNRAVACSPDGRLIASGGNDSTVKIWNASTGKLVATATGHLTRVTGLTFSPDGAWLASCGTDKTIRFWELAKVVPPDP